ncbi:hypothetical protein TrCOL_g7202 [Triparma columacea]|uniref:alpha-1,6-mannosyl-glycoprotein 6-beta-N-acetylglucosaminyltransferase n=1 Tax=Triparma columacea TaxID=722753 RepID=A0A9W7L1G3_9STRA|nr:hypothetical protein TrCOL_g7202 [Triparma columacea]
MDSLTSYSTSASKGGPAGEILVRKSLISALRSLYNVDIDVATSDGEMEVMGKGKVYDLYVFDPWTWAGPGWVLRKFVEDERKVVILDFFGTEISYVNRNGGIGGGFDVGRNVLRAYPNKGRDGKGTFLGFFIPQDDIGEQEEGINGAISGGVMDVVGGGVGGAGGVGSADGENSNNAKIVIWGKDPKYFTPRVLHLINSLSDLPAVTLVTPLPKNSNVNLPNSVIRTGHLSKAEYHSLLKSSTHLLALGHPLLGPSAVEAVSYGCVLINKKYSGEEDVKGFQTQHDYVKVYVPEKNCEYGGSGRGEMEELEEVTNCMGKRAEMGVPKEFRWLDYKARVEGIFNRFLQ